MKKLMLFLAVAVISLTSFAKGYSGDFYMVSSGEKLYCKKIQMGKETTQATLENGEKIVVATSEIKMYQLNGKIYEKMPLYVNNVNSNKEIFMEFVATRGGLKLYKYSKYEEGLDKETGAYEGTSKDEHYCVFRGNQYWVLVTDKNYQNLFNFFGAE
jgi:hypothetical protein